MNKKITKIEKQKKDEKRYSIYIDDAFAFGISEAALKKYELRVCMEFNEEEYQKLLTQMQFEKAKYRALDYLSRGDKSTRQVLQKLTELEYEEGVVAQVIDLLQKYGYIDDEKFSQRYVSQQMKVKHKSFRKIKYELYQKGIEVEKDDNDLIEEKERENVRYFLNKYHYEKGMDPKEKNKIINRMLSRGFSYSIVMAEIRKFDESFDM